MKAFCRRPPFLLSSSFSGEGQDIKSAYKVHFIALLFHCDTYLTGLSSVHFGSFPLTNFSNWYQVNLLWYLLSQGSKQSEAILKMT